MNRWHNLLIAALLCAGSSILSDEVVETPLDLSTEVSIREVLSTALSQKEELAIRDKKIWFRYKDEFLSTVINDLATHLGINVMLPQGPNALTAKLTFELPHKITLQKAWQYLITILNISGYSIIPGKTLSRIIKSDKSTIGKETLPIYINVPPQNLPDTDLKIMYLRYLTNIQVPNDGGASGASPVHLLLTDMLSSSGLVIYEPKLNGMLIIDSARIIKSAATIIDELDASISVDEPVILKLKNSNAFQVKALFDQFTGGNAAALSGGTPSPSDSGFFSADVRIVPEARTNSLIILGKEESVRRVTDFITKYIDVPIGQGKSVLHIYTLQFQKAPDFANTLNAIISGQSSAGTQSTSRTANADQYFKDVVIVPEQAPDSAAAGSKGSQSGNRLIIAAKQNDWLRIEQLIKQLDQPQPQVMIHGLIVDLSAKAQKELGSQLRNHKDFFFKNVNWQSAHMGSIETASGTGNNALPSAADALMSTLLPAGNNSSAVSTGNIASDSSEGSFILSFKDPKTNGIWLLTRLLSTHEDSKILSQPFLTAMNNKSVTVTDKETRKILGDADARFGVTQQNRIDKDAYITLSVLPRINSNNSINIVITVDIKEWVSATAESQNTRSVTTNVNLNSGDILILGGLTKTKVQDVVTKTPFLAEIPVLGNFFRSKSKIVTKSNLMIFLRPEIIYPENNITTDTMLKKAAISLSSSTDNFAQLKDPITRWFFGKDSQDDPSAQDLSTFRGEFEPIPLKSPDRETLKVISSEAPEVATQISEEPKKPSAPKKINSSSKKTDNFFKDDIVSEQEEKQAEEELKRLFGWEENSVKKQSLGSVVEKESKTTTLNRTQKTNNDSLGNDSLGNDSLSDEAQAENDLKALFKVDTGLAKKVADQADYSA